MRPSAGSRCSTAVDSDPIRAGFVKDPKDSRWSGYGKAVERMSGVAEPSGKRVLELCRSQLYSEGDEQREALDEEGRTVRGWVPAGPQERCPSLGRTRARTAVCGQESAVAGVWAKRESGLAWFEAADREV